MSVTKMVSNVEKGMIRDLKDTTKNMICSGSVDDKDLSRNMTITTGGGSASSCSTTTTTTTTSSISATASAMTGGGNINATTPPTGGGPLSPHLRPQHSSFSVNKNEEFEFKVPPEAPVFIPTVEEFKNPLTYINKIRPIAEKYGICKIRPPSTWQPPFTVNVDKLRFTPRVQRLNELEAKTRVKLNFLDQIAKFWELQGSSLKIPMVERKALDLYSLHRIVQEEGGLEQTTKDRKWSNVASRLGYPVGKSVGTILKSHYERILYPFDVFTSGEPEETIKQQKLEPDFDDHDYKPHGIVSRQKVTPPNETTARRSKRFDQQLDDCDEDTKKIKIEPMSDDKSAELRRLKFYGAGPKMSGFKTGGKCENGKSGGGGGGGGGGRMNGGNKKSKDNGGRRLNTDPLAKYICHICNRGDVEEAMLLCDGCDDSYHTFCLMPPLAEIPKGEWRCPKCVVEEVSKPTEAFGFEQAQREYTLQQFGEMADQFKADYFNIPVHLVPTELVEREFWRVVSSIDEDVVVEYGADLHTMDHGSGFPTKSSLYLLPGDQEYAESSWNLNNLPLLEESILGHINADISGMKVPWMYVGMCFATFCWHNEDHWSYSINYLHWGEPKTWYGVPGNNAEAFENTMKRAAPELFHSQPDLLHQLVTIMNPNILMNASVPVYRTDQHAGEFVITFPRAYHSGFNQGYNFAEAVNFAPADWMKIGRECINHYSTLRRFCVFSHDELVCKMALDPDKLNLGIATACYLDMAEMVDCEKKLRKSLLEWGVTKAEREAFELIPDDERQCEVCKTTCFLSAVTCPCIKALVCLRHYSELCKCAPEKHTLKYRYTLDELPLMLRKLKVKAESFENWLSKVRDVIDPNTPTTISLEDLQELAQEAEDKKFPGSVLLERLNSAVLEAEKCVTVIQQLDINKMRTRTRNSCEFAKYKLTLEELDLFVQEIDNLCCIIPEGNSVRELQLMGKEFVDTATKLLKDSLSEVRENVIEKLIDDGSSLCIELPQMKALKYLQEQVIWYRNVREIRDSDDKIPLAMIKRLLSQGLQIVPHQSLEKELTELQSIMVSVEDWETQAKKCFESGTQHEIPEIEELLERAEHIEGNLPSQPILKDALKKAKEWLATVDILQTNENYPYFHTLENVVNRGKNIPFQLEELKRMEEHLISARQWKQRTSRTFLKKTTQFALMEALSPRSEPVMSPNRNRSHIVNDEQFSQHFTEEMGPVQIVVAFKAAEEKELREMKELRQINEAKNPEIDLYCMCRRRFQGNMHHCQLCRDWFHESCVPLPRNTVKQRPSGSPTSQILIPALTSRERDREMKYLCPSCMRSRRPRLETILSLLVALQRLPIRLPEGEALQCLTERAMNWQDRARQALGTDDVVSALAILSEYSQKQISASNNTTASGNNKDKTMNTSIDSTTSNKITSSTGGGGGGTQKTTNIRPNRSSESSESSTDVAEISTTSKTTTNNAINNSSNPLSPTKNVEHAYSVPHKPLTSINIGGKNDPLIVLNKTTKDYLEVLLMEGDLLEVSLDETQHLWRLLNAAKSSISDLTYINLKYKILPHQNESLVPHSHNNRKHTTNDEQNQVPKKQLKLGRNNIIANNTVDTVNAVQKSSSVNSPLTPTSIANNGATSSGGVGGGTTGSVGSGTAATGIASGPGSGAGAGGTILGSGGGNTIGSGTPNTGPKIKRSRKMKLMATKEVNNISGNVGGGGAAAAAVAVGPGPGPGPGGNNMKKKKRGRKSVQENQAANQGSTSDEDDECSATNCVRPSGREVDWVQCDGGCNKWYHMYCVGLAKNQVKADEDYVCRNCKELPTDGGDDESGNAAENSTNTTLPATTTYKSMDNGVASSPTTTTTTTPSAATSLKTKHYEEDYPDDDGGVGKEKTMNNTSTSSATTSSTTTSTIDSISTTPSNSKKQKV